MRKILRSARFMLALLFPGMGYAYPQMIQHGYQSCMSCHYNPFGGGPLTDYGRAVAATALSDRLIFDREASEEEVAERATFLRQKPINDWLRPSLSFRGLALTHKSGDKTKTESIVMDASATLALKFLTDDRLTLVGNLGYAPTPRALRHSSEKVEHYRSREHYIGYRVSRNWGLYAGLMDKVFGLRIPDHSAFSRTLTQTTMNDQTHGVVVHGMFKAVELGLHAFVGNLVQDQSLRQQGFSGQVEYAAAKNTRLGASFLYSGSTYLGLDAYAGHVRTGLGERGAVIAEAGWTRKTSLETDFEERSRYLFLQHYYTLQRGLNTLVTAEAAKPNEAKATTTYRLGPGLQYLITGGVELRGDLMAQETYDGADLVTKSWQLLSQIHLWL